MLLSECNPGKSVYHKYGIHGILTSRIVTSKETSESLIQVTKTDGRRFWAIPSSLTEYLPKKQSTELL